jgi:hypothetical protein
VWSLLRRNQEPLLVGTAIALVVIACFLVRRSQFQDKGTSLSLQASDIGTSKLSQSLIVPSNHDYYRDKWRQIATDFYAAHPVASDEATVSGPSQSVVNASLSDKVKSSDQASTVGLVPVIATSAPRASVTPVSHKTYSLPEKSVLAMPSIASPLPMPHSMIAAKWTVACAMIAGVIAFLLFRITWPPSDGLNRKLDRTIVEGSDALRMELPAHWVSVRPSLRQRLKPIILTASYIASSVAGWSICF